MPSVVLFSRIHSAPKNLKAQAAGAAYCGGMIAQNPENIIIIIPCFEFSRIIPG
ncbi:MAG: hypothetical protein P4M02_03195 [Clostridia bacterium]|nr:hypothetical protein [Clostridia bacterium]